MKPQNLKSINTDKIKVIDEIKFDEVENQKKTVLQKTLIERIASEEICKFTFFVDVCEYVRTNTQFPNHQMTTRALCIISKMNVDNPSTIENVTVYFDGENETYDIPGFNYDGVIVLDTNVYTSSEMCSVVSNERVIEADFSLIKKIKDKAFELYHNIIGSEYTNDDLYTLGNKLIRKDSVTVHDNQNNILSMKSFDTSEDADYYYNNLITQLQ